MRVVEQRALVSKQKIASMMLSSKTSPRPSETSPSNTGEGDDTGRTPSIGTEDLNGNGEPLNPPGRARDRSLRPFQRPMRPFQRR